MDAFFTNFAAETIVVNGISVGSIVHEANQQRISTGSRLDTAADLACLSAVDLGGAETLPYLDLTGGGRVGPYAASAGALGRNNQILALLDRERPSPRPTDRPFPGTPHRAAKAAIDAYLDQQRARFAERGRPAWSCFSNLTAAAERRQALKESTILTDSLDFGTSGSVSEQAEPPRRSWRWTSATPPPSTPAGMDTTTTSASSTGCTRTSSRGSSRWSPS